ncbi:MAG: helicase [Myxococcales bacterium]|nr:helicase [Myxococcales bacterium]MCB9531009.1 helicase [Myxococcales bacterium]
MTTPADIRAQLIDALRLDLVGPSADDAQHLQYQAELLPIAPSSWYLTGFLVPYEAPADQRSDPEVDDQLDEVDARPAGDDDAAPEEASARRAFFPSSMGLSVLVGPDIDSLNVRLTWGDYAPVDTPRQPDGSDGPTPGAQVDVVHGAAGRHEEHEPEVAGIPRVWRRIAREAELSVPLREGPEPAVFEVVDSRGIRVVVSVRSTGTRLVAAGTRSVSVFVVNHRRAPESGRDAAFVFQPELTLTAPGHAAFVPRPNLHGRDSEDWDDQVADLQYRDAVEYVVGHNVSAVALQTPAASGAPNGAQTFTCQEVRSAWMPSAEVEKVVASSIPGVEFRMSALAAAGDAAALSAMLSPMVEGYAAWIASQPRSGDPSRARVAAELLQNAERAGKRIAGGIAALADPVAFEAFRVTNRAMRTAIRQRLAHDAAADGGPDASTDEPAWRPFQLAFVLMNLPGVVEPGHPDRQVVDLLFFPTGGGKTEAYLGLAAFTMVLRRMRDPSVHSAGLSVIMRYTLRLLTLDQLGRAATLVCALELERQQDVERLGIWPFEIGLWVGQSATPNRMGAKGHKDDNKYSARQRTLAFQNDDRKPSPIPLENCPWCGRKFDKNSFQLLPNANEPTDLRVFCSSRACDFHPRRQANGLPILAVDEPIYRRLPAFVIATVDKFASLPWVGETAGLFGRVDRYDLSAGFFGAWAGGRGKPLGKPLPPPDLIIQDELHLISGPLGTLVGLYETAIDALCADPVGPEGVRPKVVASTATVRRADKQIRGLFGRKHVDIFPPPGPNRRDSFFAHTVPAADKHARVYLGVAAQGRNLKVVLLRTYVALMAAAQRAWNDAGGLRANPNPADPYMTLLGYFSSLRELGGSRRIVEDEVASRLADYGVRRCRVREQRGLFDNRQTLHDPRELTSRVSTNEVAETKRRLALSFDNEKERLDVALATNMISVGLDITRLGLMVVLGQPKMTSEYIQATSRVGRDDERPGLVVTLLNVHRHRDRSHYERFTAWHESFYRAVEATSVTPFSPRAIDRGIAGVAVGLARLGHSGMTAPASAGDVARLRAELEFVAETISRRAEGHDKELGDKESEQLRQRVKKRVIDLLDTWETIAAETGQLQYQSEIGSLQRLLYDPLDSALESRPRHAAKFKAQRSLRDVEPTVNLRLRTPDGWDAEGET